MSLGEIVKQHYGGNVASDGCQVKLCYLILHESSCGVETTMDQCQQVSLLHLHVNKDLILSGLMTEEVDPFKYMGSRQTTDGTSENEVRIRLAQENSTMIRLAMLWGGGEDASFATTNNHVRRYSYQDYSLHV